MYAVGTMNSHFEKCKIKFIPYTTHTKKWTLNILEV